ncbi:hypothetical protein BST61_g508 [Cercospora zeina]
MLSRYSELTGAGQVVPTDADLEAAVAQNSMSAVFAILAEWQHSTRVLDDRGLVPSTLTTTALLSAVENARSDIVSLLLAVSCDSTLPVLQALQVGSIKNFEAFLWNGWDINEPVERDEPSALGYAIQNSELVAWFLAQGADPNAGHQHDTALSRAVLAGTFDVIEMLLAHGADVQRGDVLHWAIEREDQACEVVEMLLERGADPNHIRFNGFEPQWSVFGAKDALGTPLHRAVTLGRLDVVSKLLQHGADRNKRDTLGRTAMEIAEEKCNTAAVEVITKVS